MTRNSWDKMLTFLRTILLIQILPCKLDNVVVIFSYMFCHWPFPPFSYNKHIASFQNIDSFLSWKGNVTKFHLFLPQRNSPKISTFQGYGLKKMNIFLKKNDLKMQWITRVAELFFVCTLYIVYYYWIVQSCDIGFGGGPNVIQGKVLVALISNNFSIIHWVF